MRTDQELEALVRATLDSRARTVNTAPTWTPPANVRQRARWWLPAVAAASVVIVAIGVFIGVRLTRSTEAVHPRPTPTPTPTPKICSATLPSAWNATIRAADLKPSGADLQPIAVAPNGTVLAASGTNPDVSRTSAVIVTGERSVASVLQLPAHFVMDGRTPGADNDWAVFGTRSVAWTNDVQLWAVDLRHGNAVRKLLDLTGRVRSGGTTLQDWLLIGNDVYYTVSDTYASAHYRLYRYNLANGSRTALASGTRITMHSIYGSLSYREHPDQDTWGPQIVLVRGDIPHGTPVEVTNGETPVVTDGTAVAWTETKRRVGSHPLQTAYWWAPGSGAPVVAMQRPTDDPSGDAPAFEISATAGPFVIAQDYARGTLVADTRTHAVAAWRPASRTAAWFAGPAGGGRLPVVDVRAKLGPSTLYVPEIGSLPRLSCR